MEKKSLIPNSNFVNRTKFIVLEHFAQEYPTPRPISLGRLLFGSLTGTLVCMSLFALVYSRMFTFDAQLSDLQTDIESIYIPQEQFDTAM